MCWLSHPYQRFALLGALLYIGMVWLGYLASGERGTSLEWSAVTDSCTATVTSTAPPEMTVDTVAITPRFNRPKAVQLLPHSIDLIIALNQEDLQLTAPVLPPPPLPPPKPKISCGGVWPSERMPFFPGCNELPYDTRKVCGDQKLLEFIYANVRYPAHAREQGCAGTAIIEFIVGKGGQIEDPVIITDPGCGLGESALRAVQQMNIQGIAWRPGMQGGRNVRVKLKLPVRFKLG
jgi:TonB family protein